MEMCTVVILGNLVHPLVQVRMLRRLPSRRSHRLLGHIHSSHIPARKQPTEPDRNHRVLGILRLRFRRDGTAVHKSVFRVLRRPVSRSVGLADSQPLWSHGGGRPADCSNHGLLYGAESNIIGRGVCLKSVNTLKRA